MVCGELSCLVCVGVSYFFSQEQFSKHVGVREVNTSREVKELRANVLIWHIYRRQTAEG